MKYLKKNNVGKEKFIVGDEYLLSSLDLKLKNEDIYEDGQNMKKLKPCQI